MCQAPITLPNGQQVACHRCPQCIDLAINDWVGRNIAESKTAVASHAVTMTYGRVANEIHHERSVLLTYSDPQKYLKLLRRHDYPVRYFITGEFGGLKGRTHWHAILHWQKKVPPHVLHKRFDEQHWPHGFSFWDEADYTSMRYNCKYIMKDQGDDERQGHLAMSKKPPLGAKYFAKRAWLHVAQGIAPQTLSYDFPGVDFHKGERAGQRREFRLKGRSADLYLQEYCDCWYMQMRRPNERMPSSKLVEEYLDPGAWQHKEMSLRPLMLRDDHPDRVPKTMWRIGDIDDWEQEFERYWNGKQQEG